jgi:sugar lactone lactonase YvrE
MFASFVRRGALATVLLALACGLALLAAAGATASAGKKGPAVRTVTSWPWVDPYGRFAESLALGRDGALYASVTTWGDDTDVGQVERIDPKTGARTPFGAPLDTPGLFTGLAFDDHGTLYVANATFSDDPPAGIYRVDATGTPTLVLPMPADSFPNGLAFHEGALYVSDSAHGAIWRWQPGKATPTEPWLEDDHLAPGDPEELGANGIVFRGDEMLVAVYDAGRIVNVPVKHDGKPGKLEVLREDPLLETADGLSLTKDGTLWIAANGPTTGRLLTLGRNDKLTVVADQTEWLDYPTQPVIADTRGPGDTVYVANGGYYSGTPSIVALDTR